MGISVRDFRLQTFLTDYSAFTRHGKVCNSQDG